MIFKKAKYKRTSGINKHVCNEKKEV